MSDDVAWKWIDKLVPVASRPPMEDNDWPFKTPQVEPDSARYVYGAFIFILYGNSKDKIWDRVWVKWPLSGSNW